MILRIISDILFFLSILFFPWWMTVLFGVVAMFKFDNFIEAVIMGLFLDLLYGVPRELFFNFHFVLTFLFIFLFFVIDFLKKELRFYPKQF